MKQRDPGIKPHTGSIRSRTTSASDFVVLHACQCRAAWKATDSRVCSIRQMDTRANKGNELDAGQHIYGDTWCIFHEMKVIYRHANLEKHNVICGGTSNVNAMCIFK